jgi:hypothetical protein
MIPVISFSGTVHVHGHRSVASIRTEPLSSAPSSSSDSAPTEDANTSFNFSRPEQKNPPPQKIELTKPVLESGSVSFIHSTCSELLYSFHNLRGTQIQTNIVVGFKLLRYENSALGGNDQYVIISHCGDSSCGYIFIPENEVGRAYLSGIRE